MTIHLGQIVVILICGGAAWYINDLLVKVSIFNNVIKALIVVATLYFLAVSLGLVGGNAISLNIK